ncbi:MAG: hypothetical protein C4586_08385 [Anaerolineaceae bacterium]|nr:MAG: hypothetical protein C4586_08385 [Anaerolineaceae bacterium]
MAAKNGLLTGVEILPEELRGEQGKQIILASPKLQKMISKAHADLEGNVRLFLEEHCGVIGARDLNLPMEDLKRRMQFMNIVVLHVNVRKKPELTGTWIMKVLHNPDPRKKPEYQPLVSFPDRKMKNGQLLPQMMIPLQTSNIVISSKHIKGNA